MKTSGGKAEGTDSAKIWGQEGLCHIQETAETGVAWEPRQ